MVHDLERRDLARTLWIDFHRRWDRTLCHERHIYGHGTTQKYVGWIMASTGPVPRRDIIIDNIPPTLVCRISRLLVGSGGNRWWTLIDRIIHLSELGPHVNPRPLDLSSTLCCHTGQYIHGDA